MSVKVGAGHVRAASALEAVFQKVYPEVTVRNVEALAYTNFAFSRSFSNTYNRLVTDLPSVWGYIYEQMERRSPDSKVKKLGTLFDRLNSRPIVKLVEEFDPDWILCTHYFPAEVLAVHRRKGKLRARLGVVLTDYDIHTMWIQEGVDHYFVATEEIAYALRAKGIGAAKVSVTGIPVMPAFARPAPEPRVVRRQLGLPEAPTVLILAGGLGMAAVDETVAVLADHVAGAQFLAVAGHNETLYAAVQEAARIRPGRIVPFPFVNNIHELMAAADLVVTKSGGLTSSECLARGVPMVILRPIPGQEERNADFLLENGAAVKANSPVHLVYKVSALLADRARLAQIRAAALRIARPRAAYHIVEQVLASEHHPVHSGQRIPTRPVLRLLRQQDGGQRSKHVVEKPHLSFASRGDSLSAIGPTRTFTVF